MCQHVRYEFAGGLPPLVNCHCRFCRRAHGAAFATIAWVPRSRLRFTAGEEAVQRYGGRQGFRYFCGKCGTRLFNGSASNDGFASLIVATLDEEPERGPAMHINLESKAAWFEIHDDLPQHPTLPPEIQRAIEEMRRRE